MSELRVGQIGLGAFGVRAALRLLWNGYPTLQVFDLAHQLIRVFTSDYGGQISGSPKMMAQQCDLIVTVLPSAGDLREVCFGWEGVAKGFEPGSILVNIGTGDPFEIAQLAKELAAKDITLVDAPAFGTPAMAKEGKLTLIVGGDDAAVEKAMPVLQTLGSRILRTGAAGSGQAATAIADFLRAAELLATSEAIRLGDKFGFKSSAVMEVCDAIAGAELRGTIESEVVTRRFRSGLQLGVVRRGVDMAESFAGRLGLQSPLLHATTAAWNAAERKIGYGADYSSIIEWLERLTPPAADALPAQNVKAPAIEADNNKAAV